MSPVSPGDVLGEKYRVDRVIAEGGMGIVVAATHLTLEQPVALKFLLPAVASNAAAVERFQREARTVARLRSEHVSRILDVGELESGAPFIAMEYLEGDDLGVLFARGDEIPLETGVDWILQAAEALAEAHSLGIVHRDIKPENVFVTTQTDGSPLIKVLDFGISKVMAGSTRDRSVTSTQEVMGSPAYMSPEQLVSTRDVDHRTDVWSLGVVLYELASGQPAFYGDTLVQLCVKVMQEPHPPLGERCLGMPEGFDLVVDRCLEKDKARRFQSVAELAVALEPYAPARSRATIERIVAILGASPAPRRPVAGSWSSRPPEARTSVSWGDGRRTERGAKLFLAIGVVALGAAAAYAGLRGEVGATSLAETRAAAAPMAAPASPAPDPPAPPASAATASAAEMLANPIEARTADVAPPAAPPVSTAAPAASTAPRAVPRRPPPVARTAPPRDPGPYPRSKPTATSEPAGGDDNDVYSVRK